MYEPTAFWRCPVLCLLFNPLTLCLPSLLCNADNECEAETHQTLLLLLLIMRSYANIGAAPRVNPDNCRVRGYTVTVTKGWKYRHRNYNLFCSFVSWISQKLKPKLKTIIWFNGGAMAERGILEAWRHFQFIETIGDWDSLAITTSWSYLKKLITLDRCNNRL